MPRGDRQHHQRAGDQRCQDYVNVAPQKCRIGEQRPDVVQHRLALGVHRVTDGMLHPRVGGQDEQRREHRADRHHPDAGQVHALGQPVPTEQPQPQERRFHEERRQPLHRQRRPEHVADKARIGRPVHPELELLHEPGDHSDRHVDQQQGSEEPGHPPVLRLPGAMPGRLQDRDQERQPNRHRNEQEMVDTRRRELPTSQIVRHGRTSNRDPSRRASPRTDDSGLAVLTAGSSAQRTLHPIGVMPGRLPPPSFRSLRPM